MSKIINVVVKIINVVSTIISVATYFVSVVTNINSIDSNSSVDGRETSILLATLGMLQAKSVEF